MYGALKFTSRVKSSMMFTDSIGPSRPLLGALLSGSSIQSILYFTSAAVKPVPSWNFTPSLRKRTIVWALFFNSQPVHRVNSAVGSLFWSSPMSGSYTFVMI